MEPRNHVEAGCADKQHGGSGLQDESSLDSGERAHAIGAELAPTNGRQHDGHRHERPSDPDDDRQDMQRASAWSAAALEDSLTPLSPSSGEDRTSHFLVGP